MVPERNSGKIVGTAVMGLDFTKRVNKVEKGAGLSGVTGKAPKEHEFGLPW